MKNTLGWFSLVAACVPLIGCGDLLGGGDGGAGGGSASGFSAITLPDGQERNEVRAVFCTAADKCVIGTESNSGDPGAIFAVSGNAVGEKLVDGEYMGPASMVSNVLGDIDFIGFDKKGTSLVARVDNSSTFVSASGDFTQKASWSFVNMGRVDGDTFPLNSIDQIQGTASNEWVMINHRGFVYNAAAAPSMATTWTKIWSPLASPAVPADFAAQFAADPTLCKMDVSGGGVPSPSNPAYIAPDLSVIITVSGGLNQDGPSAPGVCISTDKGLHFYNRPFAGVPMDVSSPGPIGVYCTDKDNCWAFNGLPFQKGTAYVFFSTNASAGKTSTWTAATVPSGFATADDVELTGMFFAPDGQHGWVVGNKSRKPLMLRTTDAGKTWTDVSGSVTLAQSDLYGGFALDADHVWVVGRYGALLVSSSAQQ